MIENHQLCEREAARSSQVSYVGVRPRKEGQEGHREKKPLSRCARVRPNPSPTVIYHLLHRHFRSFAALQVLVPDPTVVFQVGDLGSFSLMRRILLVHFSFDYNNTPSPARSKASGQLGLTK